MTPHTPEERKAFIALKDLVKASERQAAAMEAIAGTLAKMADPARDRQIVALESIAEALTSGTLTGVVNLLETIDITLSNGLSALEDT